MDRKIAALVALAASLMLGGCDAINPERPTPQPDITLYGNVLEVSQSEENPESYLVQIKFGMPRALSNAREADGQDNLSVEKGTTVDVTVTKDSVVLLDGRPVSVEEFAPGTEVVVSPVSGTTFMVGTSKLLVEADYFIDFKSFRGWKLPGLKAVTGHPVEQIVADPALINTSGVEHAPVPVNGGSVLYFAARLRPPTEPGGQWIGARRDGLGQPQGEQMLYERTYRSELTADGWTTPELVSFADTDEVAVVRLTWINEQETSCLVTIEQAGHSPWVGHATRSRRGVAWSAPERVEALGEGYAADGVYLAGSDSMIAFVSTGVGLEAGDIFLLDPGTKDVPLPLDPSINTPGDEWGPRVGPNNELLFNRGDHQLIRAQQQVRPLRLAGPHRALVSEANPTRDGAWIFFCMPKLTAVESDQDIWVAPLNEDLSLGEAVLVDEWRLPAE